MPDKIVELWRIWPVRVAKTTATTIVRTTIIITTTNVVINA